MTLCAARSRSPSLSEYAHKTPVRAGKFPCPARDDTNVDTQIRSRDLSKSNSPCLGACPERSEGCSSVISVIPLPVFER